MKKETFEITNRYGLNIVGDVFFPANPIGVSVVLHGLGGSQTAPAIPELEATLFQNNYIVVNFDATNSVNESGGKYEDTTLGKHYEDLCDVISWVEQQEWFIPRRIILTGHSMGAFAVTKYGQEYPDKIKGIFAFAPVVSGGLSFEATYKGYPGQIEAWSESGWFERESISLGGLKLRFPYSHMEERLGHNLLLKVLNIIFPIVIIVGGKDVLCPSEHQEILFKLIPSKHKELHIIKDAPHTFREETHLKQLKTIFDTWLKQDILN